MERVTDLPRAVIVEQPANGALPAQDATLHIANASPTDTPQESSIAIEHA
jgi:hypothetical protein